MKKILLALAAVVATSMAANATPAVLHYTLVPTSGGVGGTLTFTMDNSPSSYTPFANVVNHVTAFDLNFDGVDFTKANSASDLTVVQFVGSDLFNFTFEGPFPILINIFLTDYTYVLPFQGKIGGGYLVDPPGDPAPPPASPARVPEPISISLLGAGLAGAATLRRRKAAKA